MNKLVVVFWGLGIWSATMLGQLFASLSGWAGWGLFGWAFMGSTARIMWQEYKKKGPKKSNRQRFFLFAIGMFIAMTFTDIAVNWAIVKAFSLEKPHVAFLLAFGAYYLCDQFDKRAEKDDTFDKLGK
ncbi:hypothetical protein [Spirosoma sp. KUDC1026]|uniref:hypothetical protein n=1 Tax=Spirosoma sp. KUDC1026 TaxID=2745947 RepID=UPI00159BBD92|nr:hypothetical protein [Spirosoma sp. KUDC1026]QKZ15177.1 hypothetical protein HU175_22150 [Spirosoma sp. KUDC1026]